jgi:hypothetical protein
MARALYLLILRQYVYLVSYREVHRSTLSVSVLLYLLLYLFHILLTSLHGILYSPGDLSSFRNT